MSSVRISESAASSEDGKQRTCFLLGLDMFLKKHNRFGFKLLPKDTRDFEEPEVWSDGRGEHKEKEAISPLPRAVHPAQSVCVCVWSDMEHNMDRGLSLA